MQGTYHLVQELMGPLSPSSKIPSIQGVAKSLDEGGALTLNRARVADGAHRLGLNGSHLACVPEPGQVGEVAAQRRADPSRVHHAAPFESDLPWRGARVVRVKPALVECAGKGNGDLDLDRAGGRGRAVVCRGYRRRACIRR